MSITKPDVPAKNVTDDWDREHAFQLGDGPRLPAGKREDTAVARWIEIDARRRDARIAGNPFAYTAAERQLKRRLLKAGLIILKPQPRPPVVLMRNWRLRDPHGQSLRSGGRR